MNKLGYEDSPLDATGTRLENGVSHDHSPSRRSFLQSAVAAAGLVALGQAAIYRRRFRDVRDEGEKL